MKTTQAGSQVPQLDLMNPESYKNWSIGDLLSMILKRSDQKGTELWLLAQLTKDVWFSTADIKDIASQIELEQLPPQERALLKQQQKLVWFGSRTSHYLFG